MPTRFAAGSTLRQDQHRSSAEQHGSHPSGRRGVALPGAAPATSRHHPRVSSQHALAPGHRDRSAGSVTEFRQQTLGYSSPQQLSGSGRVKPKPGPWLKGRQLQHSSNHAHGRTGPPRRLHEHEQQAGIPAAPYPQQSGYPS